MATVSELSPSFRLGSAQPTDLTQPTIRITAKPVLPFSDVGQAAPQFRLDAAKPRQTETQKAFQDLEKSYDKLLASINLKVFNRNKIEHYISMAEKRAGVDMSDKEKERIRELVKSEDPNVLRMLALELRVGIPRKVEKEAMAALGQLMLHRHDRKGFEEFLAAPGKDENLKAYVRTIVMMARVEEMMAHVENFKGRVRNVLSLPGLFR